MNNTELVPPPSLHEELSGEEYGFNFFTTIEDEKQLTLAMGDYLQMMKKAIGCEEVERHALVNAWLFDEILYIFLSLPWRNAMPEAVYRARSTALFGGAS